MLLGKSVKDNTTLASIYVNSKHGFIDFLWEKKESLSYIDKLKIKTPSEKAITTNLSGGNQQKVVIAKWLLAQSKILIMDEPTRGIDVNAKAEIYQLMKTFVENGGSIILVSSELPEVIGCSNRILVMREGMITGILDEQEATEERIMMFASKEKADEEG
ncbi:ATP-binding cassette domain-containing protein [Muricomes intestini]|uniref:ATP-binding cassette domain-containing protein n=1 Tax=Muricomes intestini TaxID=1796634 RepID=UPI002FE215A4